MVSRGPQSQPGDTRRQWAYPDWKGAFVCAPVLASDIQEYRLAQGKLFLLQFFLQFLELDKEKEFSEALAWGLPRWLSGKESNCQCRRCGFSPWVGEIPWRRKGQPTPVFLPGKSHGQGSLSGYSPWGCKRVRGDLATEQQQQRIIVGKKSSRFPASLSDRVFGRGI